MIGTSSANWDVPPGTGYATSALLVLAAAATVLASYRNWSADRPGGVPTAGPDNDRNELLV